MFEKTGILGSNEGMEQVVRNLTDVNDRFFSAKACLIMDRDSKYTDEFRAYLQREGVTSVLCPVRAPNCNAFAERFVRSIKSECLDRMIFFGETSLRNSIDRFLTAWASV